MQFPLVGAAYKARSLPLNAQRCVNLYPEMGGPNGKSVVALIGCPGKVLWATVGSGPIRAMKRDNTDLYVVSGSEAYRVSTAGAATKLGDVDTSTGAASIAYNGTQVAFVDGSSGWVWSKTGSTFTEVSAPAIAGTSIIDFMDGYGISFKPNSAEFYISGLLDFGTWDPLDFATAEGQPDNLVTLIVDHRQLWLLGRDTTEVWYNSGDADFPFARVDGAFIEIGCAAAQSVVKLDNSIYWLTQDERGTGHIVRAAGLESYEVISDPAVEFAISGYSTVSDAIAYAYHQEHHSFYVLTFPTANATWVYDVSTKLWHERQSFALKVLAGNARDRSNCHASFAGKTLVGDYANGKIYELSLSTYAEDGEVMEALRASPFGHEEHKRLFVSRFEIDMETGIGLQSGQGSDPQIMLRYSDDGARTWSNQRFGSIGAVGQYRTRVYWHRLGSTRNRIMEVSITDPVPRNIYNAYIEVTAGAS